MATIGEEAQVILSLVEELEQNLEIQDLEGNSKPLKVRWIQGISEEDFSRGIDFEYCLLVLSYLGTFPQKEIDLGDTLQIPQTIQFICTVGIRNSSRRLGNTNPAEGLNIVYQIRSYISSFFPFGIDHDRPKLKKQRYASAADRGQIQIYELEFHLGSKFLLEIQQDRDALPKLKDTKFSGN